jgi:hypothetical protein
MFRAFLQKQRKEVPFRLSVRGEIFNGTRHLESPNLNHPIGNRGSSQIRRQRVFHHMRGLQHRSLIEMLAQYLQSDR